MLAYDYFKKKDKLEDHKTIGVQPKLDGIRCLITYKDGEISAISRENVPFTTIDYILDEIKEQLDLNDRVTHIILDGELYLHGYTFQEVTKLVKNKPGKIKAKFYCYDTVATQTFKDRSFLINYLIGNLDYVEMVRTEEIPNTDEDLEARYTKYIEEGYEGMMVRVLSSFYKVNGRSADLLKYKKFIDIALPIEDITPNDANPSHGTVWVDFNGNRQKTGAKLSHADREDLLTNKDDYIGETAEIRYFEETDEGLMRFPVYHGIRIDK